jgi:palmitoyltransferase ZDHHC2/15/20
MDHHCPWINNCVGFWNRKYFMLLLIYVLITTYFVFFSMSYDFIQSIKWLVDTYYFALNKHNQDILIRNLTIQLAFFFVCMVGTLMTFFLKFHVQLVFSNKTTIENLDKKGKPYKSNYDIGPVNNWY